VHGPASTVLQAPPLRSSCAENVLALKPLPRSRALPGAVPEAPICVGAHRKLHSAALKTTPWPSRQGPKSLDRSFRPLDRGEAALNIQQPSKIPLARLFAQRALCLFQLPI
jgi:hypothetical protein